MSKNALKKCYSAGKIGMLPEPEYMANFAQARREIWDMDMVCICPTLLEHNHDQTWLSYMREDLANLLQADCVYAQRNWQDSKGASIEVNLALSLGIPVIYQPPKQ